MGRHQNGSTSRLQSSLKAAVKKLSFVLRFLTESKQRLALICGVAAASSRRRSLSFNDRYIGLQHCNEDDGDENSSVRVLQRTSSHAYNSSSSSYYSVYEDDDDDDIDKRAEIFISNFRRQLLYERQISLQLRYGRGNSFH